MFLCTAIYGTSFISLVLAATISVDSSQSGNEGSKGIDGNTATFWHTRYTPTVAALPHSAIIDLGVSTAINGFAYRPRQDGNSNGNIGQYQISLSPNNITWSTVATGTFSDDASLKTVSFTSTSTRYIRIVALTEAGNRGQWSSASELSVTPTNGGTGKGSWSSIINLPLTPAAAFVMPNGKILTFSSFAKDTFGGPHGYTLTAIYNPADSTVSQLNVSNTGHDMFCPGMSFDPNGRAIITGGDDAAKTSIYDYATNTWSSGSNMKISRGSWSGGNGGKNGEIYNSASNSWTLLGGCPVLPMLTADVGGIFRQDNHAWLFGWKNGYVFQGGPSKAMNWYGTTGGGSQIGAGLRASDPDSMDGNAVIVVLPNGKVMITGGQTFAVPFSDNTAILIPELWDPATLASIVLPAHAVARTYHSFALLMLDGRVFTGGGGLCGGCSTNHPNAEIYSPSYLFNADGTTATRPVISSISASSVGVGNTISITTSSAVTSFSIVRFGSATHTVNTDQRRISLSPINTVGTTYTFSIPDDSGVALPGFWMFFASNSAGVPSVAKAFQITVS
ncbi:Galactose-binding protein [Glarea lozoyensis ATCC 20868]|uniref:Galactose-binding protein n=1 Tax=Glarea lozoyensis (strain ATCC 20868 / MF5171) TaxID=1116229 RepID=S3D1T9_GLAL2|nr:Galactose-binding protein [Glarea lozoyensis ATCC 20868]EPE31765.1 Galactose-binding protein [Glarea lozoyensis ATCC 20868]